MKNLTKEKEAKDKLKIAVAEARREGYLKGIEKGKDKMIQAVVSWTKRSENENHKFKEFIERWFEKTRIENSQRTCRECPDCDIDTLCTAASRVGCSLPDCPICDFHIKRLADGYNEKTDRIHRD